MQNLQSEPCRESVHFCAGYIHRDIYYEQSIHLTQTEAWEGKSYIGKLDNRYSSQIDMVYHVPFLNRHSLETTWLSRKDTNFVDKYGECIWSSLPAEDTSRTRTELFSRRGVIISAKPLYSTFLKQSSSIAVMMKEQPNLYNAAIRGSRGFVQNSVPTFISHVKFRSTCYQFLYDSITGFLKHRLSIFVWPCTRNSETKNTSYIIHNVTATLRWLQSRDMMWVQHGTGLYATGVALTWDTGNTGQHKDTIGFAKASPGHMHPLFGKCHFIK